MSPPAVKRPTPKSAAMEQIRAAQIQQIVDSTDSSEKTLLVGDLNAGPDSSPDNYQQVLDAGFVDTFFSNGITWDPANPLVEVGLESHLPPNVLTTSLLINSSQPGARSSTRQIVMDEKPLQTRLGATPLSDHYGVLTTLRL